MITKETLADQYAESFRYKAASPGGWYQEKRQDFLAGYEAAIQQLQKPDVSGSLPVQICYKSNEPCKHNCQGLCRDSF